MSVGYPILTIGIFQVTTYCFLGTVIESSVIDYVKLNIFITQFMSSIDFRIINFK